jgi:uncharacterized protein DUF4383
MANAILNPKNYAKITGLALAATAVLGIALSAMGKGGMYGLFCSEPTATTCDGDAADQSFLGFDWAHNILHVVLAGIALVVGFTGYGNMRARLYAQIFGPVYTLLGVVGFFVADLGILHLEVGENLVHLAVGGYGLLAGFLGTMAPTTTPTTATTPMRR